MQLACNHALHRLGQIPQLGLAFVQDGDQFPGIVIEFFADLLNLADGLAG